MFNNSQSPLEHLAANALAFAAGAIVVIAGQAYGWYVRRQSRCAPQAAPEHNAKADRPAAH